MKNFSLALVLLGLQIFLQTQTAAWSQQVEPQSSPCAPMPKLKSPDVYLMIHPPLPESGPSRSAELSPEMRGSTRPLLVAQSSSDSAASAAPASDPVQLRLPNAKAAGGASQTPSPPTTSQSNFSATPFAPEGTLRRCLPAAFDPVFPSTEYIGVSGQVAIGVPDTDPIYPLEKAIYQACPNLKKARIKIYGWVNPGMDYSSSHHSNIPNSYAIVPRRLELDQAILRIERIPDTVQTEHSDWGFRYTSLYGIDYRWTTAQGWYPASQELLQHNYLYGYDPVECYGVYYTPKVAQGMVTKVGRFISPPDIEAQLAPDNYLWTHSQMFTVDCYTQTGILNSIKLNDNWTIQAGIQAGCDIAPWDKAAIPSGEFLVRWISKTNDDSIYGGIDSINNGKFRLSKELLAGQAQVNQMNSLGYNFNPDHVPAHDNLQQANVTWSHRFSRRVHMATEGYILWSKDALTGGTVDWGAPRPFNLLTGPGTFLHGNSVAWGLVNYTNFKCTNRDYITLRPIDYLGDTRGWRTGFPTTYSSWTIGWCHHFSDLLLIRPEIRYDRALSYHNGTVVTPYDNGTRRFQFTFGMDLIQRF